MRSWIWTYKTLRLRRIPARTREPEPEVDSLLQENGDDLLQENGDLILLEDGNG